MTQEERQAVETNVDRHLRRGELPEAWAALHQLVVAFPEDAAVAARLAQLEESLDPMERQRVAPTRAEPTGGHKSPMHQAESLAAAGRYKEAIAIYRALLASRPDWELVKERLAELFQLAQVAEPKRTPVNREGLLEHLLERINARKRG
jgi:Flp pilus assembly protein TadD